jgi:SAM-dependent methyltransferase
MSQTERDNSDVTVGEGAETAEVRVSELMSRIRESVARKEAAGTLTPIDVQPLLLKLQSEPDESDSSFIPRPQLSLARIETEEELTPITEGAHYHVNELLKYHDKEFIRNAYRALLKRDADDAGFNQNLDGLRSGRYNKIDILSGLRYSGEGRERNVPVKGLFIPATLRTLYRVPVLGYITQLFVALMRLPVLVRNHSQLEAHTFVQRERLFESIRTVAGSVEQVADTVRTVEESFKRAIKDVEDSFNAMVKLQHQQINALFREQREIIDEQKELFDLLSVRHALEQQTGAVTPSSAIEERVKELSERVEDLRSELARQQRLAALLGEQSLRWRPDDRALTDAIALASEDRERLDALYASFEDRFRGDREEVKARLRFYLPFLREAGVRSDILDVGCGRGDWLELLQEEGLEALGVETNGVLASRCRESGLRVVQKDALAYLRALPARCLNAVTGFHIIEHLPFETLVDLMDEILRTLKPGGLVMLESPSPENLVVAASNFYADPTHNRPVSPHTLKFILAERGFEDIRLQFLHPVEGSPFAGGAESLHALHMWFYGPRDYAVIASKS